MACKLYNSGMDQAKDNDNASQVSASSRSTSASAVSAAARARAKAEAACTRAAFADKEIKLKLEKARLDAELEALALQREAAAAVVQAEVLEAAEKQVKEPRSKSSKASVKRELDRTSAYVQQQNKLHMASCHEIPACSLIQHDDSLVTWGSEYGIHRPDPSFPLSAERLKQHISSFNTAPPKEPSHVNRT